MSPTGTDLAGVLARLERIGTRRTIQEMGRYGLVARRAYGVPMGKLLALSRQLGTDQPLSLALWESGWYEARLLAALIGDPERVTRRQMDAWATSFENWGDCDTVCFKLFDRSPFAWEMAQKWAASPKEFVKRGGFVLMACLALHDKEAPDRNFLPFLPLLEQGASDPRNFVKKGVVWALRGVGGRNPALRKSALAVAGRLAEAEDAASRWVGKATLREMNKKRNKSESGRAKREGPVTRSVGRSGPG